jgi:hypothetical protein
MSVFDTDSRLPFTSGVIAIAAAIGGAMAAIIAAALLPLSGLTFVFVLFALSLLGLSGWLGYALYGYLRSSYAIDRNAFVVRWGASRVIVPMGDIQRVFPADELADGLQLRRFPLAGWWRGAGRHPALGALEFYSTQPVANQIVVVTPDRNFVVSPYDTEAFLDAFKARFDMQPTQPVQFSQSAPAFLEWAFWRDRVAHVLLIAAFALNLGMFGVSLARYPSAPAQVPLHFNATGVADRLGSRTQMFTPAIVGLILLTASAGLGVLLYVRRERLLAYLLWGGSVAVQAMFAVAAFTVAFSSL